MRKKTSFKLNFRDINHSVVKRENRISLGSDFNKSLRFERFKIKPWHLFLDKYLSWFSNIIKTWRESKDRIKIINLGTKRLSRELNVIKLLQKVRLSMEIARI